MPDKNLICPKCGEKEIMVKRSYTSIQSVVCLLNDSPMTDTDGDVCIHDSQVFCGNCETDLEIVNNELLY